MKSSNIQGQSEVEAAVLRDGTEVAIRLIRADDARRLQALVRRLSAETIFQRSRLAIRELPDDYARRLAEVDHRTHTALVATISCGDDEEIIGAARYALMDNDEGTPTGEVAIVVEDAYQRQGLGRILLERLIARARALGVRKLAACVHYQNQRVLQGLRSSGLPVTIRKEPGCGEMYVELALEGDEGRKT